MFVKELKGVVDREDWHFSVLVPVKLLVDLMSLILGDPIKVERIDSSVELGLLQSLAIGCVVLEPLENPSHPFPQLLPDGLKRHSIGGYQLLEDLRLIKHRALHLVDVDVIYAARFKSVVVS